MIYKLSILKKIDYTSTKLEIMLNLKLRCFCFKILKALKGIVIKQMLLFVFLTFSRLFKYLFS